MSQSTTALLARIREQDQAEVAARHNGERKRRSAWAVETLRNRLPPDHYALANRLVDMQACIEGVATCALERVDGANSVETALNARIDAAREMAGYEAAALTRWNANAVRCLRGIVALDSYTELTRRCGFAPRSKATVPLLQCTLAVLQDYRDECLAAQSAWALTGDAPQRHRFR